VEPHSIRRSTNGHHRPRHSTRAWFLLESVLATRAGQFWCDAVSDARC
jgi:hypothetical protein